MDLPGGIAPHDPRSEDLRGPSAAAGEFHDLRSRLLEERPVRDRVEVHDAPLANVRDCGGEELPRRLREVHDHAVHRREPREELLARSLVDDDRLRPVPPGVLPQQVRRGGVRIDRVDRLRLPRAGDQNRVWADPREHVHDDLPGSHLLGNSQPFRSEAGGEVRVLHVDDVPQAELHVFRPSLRLPRHDTNLADPEFARNALIDCDGADLRVPSQDRVADRSLEVP